MRLLLAGLIAASLGGAAPVNFTRDVRPILSDHCFACHGPDDAKRVAGVRLDTEDGARKVIGADAAASKLYQRVSHTKAVLRMPPASTGRTLTEGQIATLKQWIDEGAKWQSHWAYLAPVRAEPPAVKNEKWARTAIDRFIAARLEREGLAPSAEADRATLLRRVSLDLTGLPPAPADVAAFLRGKSPDAYEKQVDRLLASKHYGERMALQWLDLARYADTHGFHIDSHRDMWQWRDWVISAFNRNLPYDQFTVWQIAGDLLPDATREQKLATGFNRNHMINFEGGAIPEEYQVEYVIDRVESTATTWLGMTAGCARCHDHKYDPIKQRDFYRLFAFFNTVPEEGLDGRYGNAKPMLELPDDAQAARMAEVKSAIEAAEAKLPETEIAAKLDAWAKERIATLPRAAHDGVIAHWDFDGNLNDVSGGYRHGVVRAGTVGFGSGPAGQGAGFDGSTIVDLGDAGAWSSRDKFTIAFYLSTSAVQDATVMRRTDAARRGWEITAEQWRRVPDLKSAQTLHFRMIERWPDRVWHVRTRDPFVQGSYQHVVLTNDGGLKMWIDGKPAALETVSEAEVSALSARLTIGEKVEASYPFKGSIDDIRLFTRVLTAKEIEDFAVHVPVASLIAVPKRNKDQNERLRNYYLTWDAPPEWRAAHAELKRLKEQKKNLDYEVPTAMVMSTMEKTRDTFVLSRGDYRNKTDKVEAGVPSWLPPLPEGAPANRLGLAKWLVDPKHPLTARVAVNRFWQMAFGTGLVKTAEDFGSQGEAPVNPELLDWLATEFVRTGWDVKGLMRLIVTSAAYRQSSKTTPQLTERDPENRLVARGPRVRLPAEFVRDNALAVSGLLNERIGGASVYPYQPAGVWEDVAYGGVYSAQEYTPSTGSDLYRRSMYTFWKRTAPHPALAAFDAPDREKCTARRPATNTPLQALVLMNDPTYVEAARALASRMLTEGGKSPAQRLTFGFGAVTARTPSSKELRLLVELARSKSADFRRDTAAADQLLAVGESKVAPGLDRAELAGYTTAASVILMLDEAITKE